MKVRKLTEVPKSLRMIDVKAILRKRGVYLAQKVNRDMRTAAMPLAKKLIESRKRPVVKAQLRHHQFTNEQVMAYWEKQIHIVEVLEKKFDAKLQQFIGKIVNGFLSQLEQEITTKDYFTDNEDDLLVEAQFDFTPLLTDQAVLAGQEALDLIGSKDVYTPFALRKIVADNVAKFTQSMLSTDRDTLTKLVADGLANGQSVPEIRRAIQTTFDSFSKMQAQRITRTEVLRASNQAALDAWQQSGLVEGKQWLTAGAVDECADYEGQIEALDGGFYPDTTEFADGDPPLHPNCRCVLLPVLIGEKAYVAQSNKGLIERIKELEDQVDKRTKEYREIKELKADDEVYIKSLEKILGSNDERG